MPLLRVPKIVYELEVPDGTSHADLEALGQELLTQWKATTVNRTGGVVVSWEWKIETSLGRTQGEELV